MYKAILFLLLFSQLNLVAQDWTNALTIDQTAQMLRLDQLNNLYAITEGQIIKYDEDGKELSRYSNKLIGSNISVDVTNPMKVLIFSSEQMQIRFLDSRLGELQESTDLFSKGFEQVSLAATSHSNGYWIYEPIAFELIRFDQHSKEVRRSFNLAQLFRNEFAPTDMQEFNNKLYVCDPDLGIYVFDIFGTYLKRLPILGVERMNITNNRIFYRKGEKLEAFNLLDLSFEEVAFQAVKDNSYDINKSRIAMHEGDAIKVFKPSR